MLFLSLTGGSCERKMPVVGEFSTEDRLDKLSDEAHLSGVKDRNSKGPNAAGAEVVSFLEQIKNKMSLLSESDKVLLVKLYQHSIQADDEEDNQEAETDHERKRSHLVTPRLNSYRFHKSLDFLFPHLGALNDYIYAVNKVLINSALSMREEGINNYDRKIAFFHDRSEVLLRGLLEKGFTLYADEQRGMTGEYGLSEEERARAHSYNIPYRLFAHEGNKVLVVVHPGSCGTGSMVPNWVKSPTGLLRALGWFPGVGDWGANYDSTGIVASAIQPESYDVGNRTDNEGTAGKGDKILLHRGFVGNYMSFEAKLLEQIQEFFNSKTPQESKKWSVIVTGHSKGAAMASLSIPRIKLTLGNRVELVGGVIFSAPRVFKSDEGRRWVHNVVGKRNIIRINVEGDPVPVAGLQRAGFRSIGVLALDNDALLLKRYQDFCQNSSVVLPVGILGSIAPRHYGSTHRTWDVEKTIFTADDAEFLPALIPNNLWDLRDLLDLGSNKKRTRGQQNLLDSMGGSYDFTQQPPEEEPSINHAEQKELMESILEDLKALGEGSFAQEDLGFSVT